MAEAEKKLHNYKAVMNQTRQRYDALKATGIECEAFLDLSGHVETIQVTNRCWKHVFEHPKKRRSEVERLERALTFQAVIKLLRKARTYQEVSIEKDKGGRTYLSFGIIGYVNGNRIKVLVRRDRKITNAKKILFSFFQIQSAPRKVDGGNDDEDSVVVD
jgi:hypothetical protein